MTPRNLLTPACAQLCHVGHRVPARSLPDHGRLLAWHVCLVLPGDRATRDFLAGFPPSLSPAGRQALYQGIWGEKQAEHEGSERAAVEPPPPPPPVVDRPPLEPLVFPPASVAALPVWTDMPVLRQYLSDPRFPFTDDKTGESGVAGGGCVG